MNRILVDGRRNDRVDSNRENDNGRLDGWETEHSFLREMNWSCCRDEMKKTSGWILIVPTCNYWIFRTKVSIESDMGRVVFDIVQSS